MHGTVDNEGTLSARANWRWTESLVTRTNTQLAAGSGQAMVQLDQDYTGKDFSASLKTINPSVLDGGLTGIYIGSYMQALTRGLALGLEAVWQRQALNTPPEAIVSYAARYRSDDWIASAQLQPDTSLNTSYWRRLTDKVEVGADLTVQFQPGPGSRAALMGAEPRRDATATVGAKYDFRASTFRAQADSTGKVSTVLEKRVLPFVQVTFAGELDQAKVSGWARARRFYRDSRANEPRAQQTAKVGLGISVEVPNDDIMEQQQEMMASSSVTPPPY